jgi:hypothetical protein
MPTLEVNNFNIVLSVLGGWISLFGLVSYLCKEHFYLSEACESHSGRPAHWTRQVACHMVSRHSLLLSLL